MRSISEHHKPGKRITCLSESQTHTYMQFFLSLRASLQPGNCSESVHKANTSSKPLIYTSHRREKRNPCFISSDKVKSISRPTRFAGVMINLICSILSRSNSKSEIQGKQKDHRCKISEEFCWQNFPFAKQIPNSPPICSRPTKETAPAFEISQSESMTLSNGRPHLEATCRNLSVCC